ncbi:hypothetical protein HQ585_18215 [candidate division KSB1 bacterium]|nr:hypothetical protein [candidate division KSB1 bacterium]
MLKTLRERAVRVLKANDTGAYTKPSPGLYPHQWNWDSAFIAIGLSHVDEERARREILSLFRGQWKNGMIPHIIFDPDSRGYHPDPAYWGASRSPMAPEEVSTSGITQPPMLAVAAWAVFRNSKDREHSLDFLRTVFPRLKSYHAFLHRDRTVGDDGLAAIVHPWESGLDNSPRWDEPLRNICMDWQPQYQRHDRNVVPADQRPSDDDYDRYSYLVEFLRSLDWDEERVLTECPFLVQPVLFNVILLAADRCLKQMAELLGEDTYEIDHWISMLERGIVSKLWDQDKGVYTDYDVRGQHRIVRNTIVGFMPLYAGLVEAETAHQWAKRLKSGGEFWPEQGHPFCTVSVVAPEFDPMNYWRGPVWINMNWFLICGLMDSGFEVEARQIIEKTLTLVHAHGYHEYFNPFTGEGYGGEGFSWTASLVLDLIDKVERCD